MGPFVTTVLRATAVSEVLVGGYSILRKNLCNRVVVVPFSGVPQSRRLETPHIYGDSGSLGFCVDRSVLLDIRLLPSAMLA